MALTHTTHRDGHALRIELSGDFTFSQNAAFRRIVEEVAASGATAVSVGLSALRTVDSAGLSMLVLLRERLVKVGGTVTLCRPPTQVARILEVVDFGKLFQIIP
jgi:anti-anti-sigma factor